MCTTYCPDCHLEDQKANQYSALKIHVLFCNKFEMNSLVTLRPCTQKFTAMELTAARQPQNKLLHKCRIMTHNMLLLSAFILEN